MELKDNLIEKARKDLLYFIVYMDPEYIVAKHHRFICKLAMKALTKPKQRIIISVPPRHGKSTIVSQYLVAFAYGYFSTICKREIILVSYSADLPKTFGKTVRRIVNTKKYKSLFPNVKVLGEGEGGGHFEFSDGSKFKGQGRKGSLTGFGGNLIIVDDLIKDAEEAASPVIRNKCKQFWDSTLYPRLLPGGSCIVMATRWHEDDLSGYLINNDSIGEWEYYNLEAICEDKDDPLGRKIGEALWPEWYDIDYFDPIRKRNAYQFSALYQGKPVAKEGNVMDSAWISYYKDLPDDFDSIICSWDTSSSIGNKSAFNAGAVFGIKDGIAYLLDIVHDRYKFPDLLEAVEVLAGKWGIDFLLIENASSGTQIIQTFERRSLRYKLVAISKQTNKSLLFQSSLTAYHEGRVFFPLEQDKKFRECYDQIIGYPYASYSDLTIAVTQAIVWWKNQTNDFTRELKATSTGILLKNNKQVFTPTKRRNCVISGSKRRNFVYK